VVVVAVIVGLDLVRRWMMRTLRAWPVALAIHAFAAVTFFSEGVPINLYKSFLAIAAIEVVYRYVSTGAETRAPHRAVETAFGRANHPSLSRPSVTAPSSH